MKISKTYKSVKTIFALFITYSTILNASKINPLSKISITSDRATCSKQSPLTDEFSFKYIGNVQVELSDNTKVTAQELDIICKIKSLSKSKKKDISNNSGQKNNTNHTNKKSSSSIKKITLTGSVTIKKDDLFATSSRAEIFVPSKYCRLHENVCIEHKKQGSQDLPPMVVRGNIATINLDSKAISLEGSSKKPVSTIIDLSQQTFHHKRKIQKKS